MKVSIEAQDDGRVKPNVAGLGEPKSSAWLRGRVDRMRQKIDLPDLLFGMNAWTVFLDAFAHLEDGTTRMKDLPTSVVALLVSEACDIALAPVLSPGYEAPTGPGSRTSTSPTCAPAPSPRRTRGSSRPGRCADREVLGRGAARPGGHRQLTVQESRHKLARDVCHGKRGTIYQAYRDGMENQLGALGLVLVAIAFWTTRYIDATVAQLKAQGRETRDEDIARPLSCRAGLRDAGRRGGGR